MWILSFLPEWVFHLILGLGILGVLAGFVLGFLPFVRQYKLPIQIISIIVLSLGLYLEGGLADYKEWESKVKELEAQVAVAEEKAKTQNVVIQEVVVEKIKHVQGKTQTITKYIDREVVKKEEIIKYIENCPVPKEIIDIHNNAALMTINEAAEGKK